MSYWSVSDELNFGTLIDRHPFLKDLHLRGKEYTPHVTAPWERVMNLSVPETGESREGT